jgi:hypothetical protein
MTRKGQTTQNAAAPSKVAGFLQQSAADPAALENFKWRIRIRDETRTFRGRVSRSWLGPGPGLRAR